MIRKTKKTHFLDDTVNYGCSLRTIGFIVLYHAIGQICNRWEAHFMPGGFCVKAGSHSYNLYPPKEPLNLFFCNTSLRSIQLFPLLQVKQEPKKPDALAGYCSRHLHNVDTQLCSFGVQRVWLYLDNKCTWISCIGGLAVLILVSLITRLMILVFRNFRRKSNWSSLKIF